MNQGSTFMLHIEPSCSWTAFSSQSRAAPFWPKGFVLTHSLCRLSCPQIGKAEHRPSGVELTVQLQGPLLHNDRFIEALIRNAITEPILVLLGAQVLER